MLMRVAGLLICVALGACSNKSAPAAASPPAKIVAFAADGPPKVDGVYIYGDCEGEGGCPFLNWRTIEPTPLLTEQSLTSSILATLTPGEWVKVERVETRLIPIRGVVRESTEDLRVGEIVYQLEYEGEGVSNYWIRGGQRALADSALIDWEQPASPPDLQATLGLWAQIRRENGQIGWIHQPRFECMGQLGGDENCRD